jgi:hypothetical protein
MGCGHGGCGPGCPFEAAGCGSVHQAGNSRGSRADGRGQRARGSPPRLAQRRRHRKLMLGQQPSLRCRPPPIRGSRQGRVAPFAGGGEHPPLRSLTWPCPSSSSVPR